MDAAIEIAQKHGLRPSEPDHMLEREHRIGVFHRKTRLAEAVGRDDEPRDVPLAQSLAMRLGGEVSGAAGRDAGGRRPRHDAFLRNSGI